MLNQLFRNVSVSAKKSSSNTTTPSGSRVSVCWNGYNETFHLLLRKSSNHPKSPLKYNNSYNFYSTTATARAAAVVAAAADTEEPVFRVRGQEGGVRSLSSSTTAPYDVVVIGGGPGGYVAAIKAAQLGLKTACVEMRGRLGGTCLNVGCIPSKALLTSTHHYHDLLHSFASHGIVVPQTKTSSSASNEAGGGVYMDVAAMHQSKNNTVESLTGGIEYLLKKNKVEYIVGKGRLGPDPHTVSVDPLPNDSKDASPTTPTTLSLQAKNILIATGSAVAKLPPVPVDNAAGYIVDSTGALDIPAIPTSLAIIGGGVIGLEMGSVWSRLGTQVTVIEFLDRICPSLDTEISKKFLSVLKQQGLKFQLNTKVTASRVDIDANHVVLTTESSKHQKASSSDLKETTYDRVLVATGRVPYTDGLGLDTLGIETDTLGRIQVDAHFRTLAVPHIYAIGDCIDGPMLAHKAEEEGIAAVEIMAGYAGHVNYDAIPGVIYTYPEVASVGKTEDELKAAKIQYTKGTFPFSANSRARANASTDGLVKVLADAATDQILGAHIIGPNAGEMIAEAVIAIEYGASSEDIARTCHAHPTLSEAFKEACMDTYDKPIHF